MTEHLFLNDGTPSAALAVAVVLCMVVALGVWDFIVSRKRRQK